MAMVAKNVRYREDQLRAIEAMEAADPETDLSKITRRAVDEFLARRRRTNSVLEDEPRYQILERKQLSLTNEAFVVTDPDGRVTDINQAFTEMCGYTLDELRGQKPGVVLRPKTVREDRRTLMEFRRAISERKAFEGTLTNYDKNGIAYRVHIQMHPLFEGSTHTGFEAVERRLD